MPEKYKYASAHKQHLAMKNINRPRILFYGLLLYYFAFGLFLIYNSPLAYDEAYYLYKGYHFVKGDLVPYRDIFPEYGPLSFYIPGIFQYVFGPGFFTGRLVSFFFSLAAVLLLYKTGEKLVGSACGLIACAFVVLNVSLNYLYTVNIYAPVFFFVTASFYSLVAIQNSRFKIAVSLLFMALALFTRQNFLPSYLMLAAYLFITEQPGKNKIFTVLCGFLIPFIFLLPFLGVMKQFTLSFFAFPLQRIFKDAYPQNIPSTVHDINFAEGSVIYSLRFLMDYFFLFVTYASCKIFMMTRAGNNAENRSPHKNLLIFFNVFFWVNFAVHLWNGATKSTGNLVCYNAYFIYVMALLSGAYIQKITETLNNGHAKKLLYIFLSAGIALTPATNILRTIRFPLKSSQVKDINQCAGFLRKYTAPEDKLLYIGLPHLLLAADRMTYPALMNDVATYSTSRDMKMLEYWHYYNDSMVERWISGDARVVVITKEYFDGLKKLPVFKTMVDAVTSNLDEKYFLSASAACPWQGAVMIYKRKNTRL